MNATQLLRNLFSFKPRTNRKSARPAAATARLAVESLEQRECPAATSVLSSSGVLTVTGSEGSDVITIQDTGFEIAVAGRYYQSWRVNKIVVNALGGHDIVRNNTSINSVINGGGGRDTLHGGNGSDQLFGGSNNDSLFGGNGNDDLYGEQGDDTLVGASGTDGYETGNTNDTLQGGDGKDVLYGGYGNDILIGGNDNDLIYGQWGDDMIAGARWDFTLHQPLATESVTQAGSTVNDTLFGENGNDSIYGGNGNDKLSGGFDSDEMYGEDGDDRMWGAFESSPNERPLNINQDTLRGGRGNDTLSGGADNDWLYGDEDDDHLMGDAGNDALEGGSGNDWLEGGADNDNLVGNQGIDWMYGGAGNDTLWGAEWQNNHIDASGNPLYQDDGNFLFGDDDADDLYGGNGVDYLSGGEGNDGLFGGANDGRDVLDGGAGADRILMPQDYFLGYLDEDEVDFSFFEDAKLNFITMQSTWNDREIAALDVGFQWLHRVTNNTSLLHLANGGEMTFQRMMTLGNALADNDDLGNIRVADRCFSASLTPAQTIVHEIGHNWDMENARYAEFWSLSGWTWLDTPEPGAIDEVPEGYTRASWRGVPKPYIYLSTSEFARDYGRNNPYDDFATCLEIYFAGTKPASEWQTKWDFIDQFIRDMSS